MNAFVVATIHEWNVRCFHKWRSRLPGDWHLLTTLEELTIERLRKIAPRYIFFPHWSWPVPQDVLEAGECVGFHMTDLPFGRGGSPLQNLISLQHSETVLCALRMSAELDAGPVFLRRRLSLTGRAQEIYERAADLIFEMIEEIVRTEPMPVKQAGEVVLFCRRTAEQSRIATDGTLDQLYDHIRMLDAHGYPKAFLDHGEVRVEFTSAEWRGGRLTARAHFFPRKTTKGRAKT